MAKTIKAALIAVLLLCILACALPVPQTHAAGLGALTVTVKNESNNTPIVGANVTISGPASGMQVTDSNGVVVFSNIPSGNYLLVVSAKEYPTQDSHDIQVNGDTNILVSFGYTKAFFTFSPENPVANRTISFNATQSTSSGNITNYQWDFGDGTTGTGALAQHVYTKSGSYHVLLTVTSTHGVATYSRVIPIAEVNQNGPGMIIWVFVLIPFILIIPLVWLRRRRYYVVIQARVPPTKKHPLCPGNDTICEDCKLWPC